MVIRLWCTMISIMAIYEWRTCFYSSKWWWCVRITNMVYIMTWKMMHGSTRRRWRHEKCMYKIASELCMNACVLETWFLNNITKMHVSMGVHMSMKDVKHEKYIHVFYSTISKPMHRTWYMHEGNSICKWQSCSYGYAMVKIYLI